MDAETLISNTIATPVATIVQLDGEQKPREVLAVINDSNIGEPFTLYKSDNAWWTDITKVEKLMFCFKNDMLVEEACFSVGISYRQYYYFTQIHPEFCNVKELLSQALPAVAKLTLGVGLQKDPQLALRYLQGAQPETYRRSVMPEMPGGGSRERRTEEVFKDAEGNITMTRKMAEYIEQHGTGNN
jgi:hypothetical protein